jgi:uncharacterized protein YhfF
MDQERITTYWQRFLATLPAEAPAHRAHYVAESFGDNPALADELAALVMAGAKTATCSALWEWEAEGQALPPVGLHTIVLDGQGVPVCIIETTEVTVRAYEQVDAQFAWEEGEGDRSLDYWRAAHWSYFTRTLPRIGRTPAPDMPLVCERFRLVYVAAGRE